MDDLSPETIRQILRHIPAKSDLENFRLVQHSFADLGKEFLFHTIDVWPTRESLTRLHKLSYRSDIAAQVKCLILNVVYDTKNLIWGRVKERLHFLNTPHSLTWDLYQHNTWIFKSFAKECYEFLTSRDHSSILMASLIRLKKLEAVYMRDGGGNERSVVTASEERAHFGAWGIREYDGAPASWIDPNSYFAIEALRALIDASRYTNTKIKSFQSINEIPQCIFEDATLLKGLAGFVKDCRDLQLRFDTENHEYVIPYLQKNPLAIVFSSTKLLEKLNLQFSVRPDITVGFTKLLGDKQISPYLKEVNFVGIDMHDHELYAFLSFHKASLSRFSVQYSRLFTGFWLEVAIWMRENICLESAKFVGLTNSNKTHPQIEEEEFVSVEEMKIMEEYVLGRQYPPPTVQVG